jgi:hypothetical protein
MRLAAAMTLVPLLGLLQTAAAAGLPDVTIDDTLVFPESLDASANGTLYIGSWKGIIYRSLPGTSSAKPWVQPSAENGLLSVLGVLVDEKRGQVWVCSVPAPNREPPAPGTSALMAFDIKTGAQRALLPLPAPASVCNDITLAKDGTAYVSDTPNGRIFKVPHGTNTLELFMQDDRLKGVDGIVFSGDGKLYVNLVTNNTLWRIGMTGDGKPDGLTPITPSQPVDGPDGFRLVAGNRFVLEENRSGRLDEVTISGDTAAITVLKDGLMTPTSAVAFKHTIYAVERKFDYVKKPELKGKDPGPFKVLALPLPH